MPTLPLPSLSSWAGDRIEEWNHIRAIMKGYWARLRQNPTIAYEFTRCIAADRTVGGVRTPFTEMEALVVEVCQQDELRQELPAALAASAVVLGQGFRGSWEAYAAAFDAGAGVVRTSRVRLLCVCVFVF